ncbi:MAG: DUF2231 domain-containing protein [Microthrixaceae bacterium]
MSDTGSTTDRPELSAEGRAAGERARDAAHRPGTVLAGRYGHPIHPALAPIAIGAWVSAVAFDLASVFVEGRAYGRPAQWLVLIGIVAALVASVPGFLDYRRLTKGSTAHKVATTHLIVMDLVLLCFIASFFIRRADQDQLLDGTPIPALVLSLIGLVGLGVGGWLGGELSYRYGVRVADEEDQIDGHRPRGALPSAPSHTADESAEGSTSDTADGAST